MPATRRRCALRGGLLAAALAAALRPAPAGATDWCALKAALNVTEYDLFSGGSRLEKLMQGQTLKVVAMLEPPWSVLNETADGTCDCPTPGCTPWCVIGTGSTARSAGAGKQLSGIDIDAMAAIANRGEFKVEYHYEPIPDGVSWTEMLIGNSGSGVADRYDMIAGGGWLDTSSRRQLGVHFNAPMFDQGIVLAIHEKAATPPGLWDNAWFWVKPFEWSAYLMVLVFWLLPATLVMVLESLGNEDFKGRSRTEIVRTSLRDGFLNILGFGDFAWPSQAASRMIMALWAVIVLVVLCVYTANMTAFLVVSHTRSATVKNVDEFIAKQMVACLPEGYGSNVPITSRFPDLRYVEVPDDDISMRVVQGEVCQGVLMGASYLKGILRGSDPRSPRCNTSSSTAAAWRRAMPFARATRVISSGSSLGGSASSSSEECTEWGCQLQIVGQTEVPLSGTFPSGFVSETNCRWFMLQVISSVTRSLAEDGTLRTLFSTGIENAAVRPNGMPRCSAVADNNANKAASDTRITAGYLLGVFLVCCSPMTLFFVYGVYRIRQQESEDEMAEQMKAMQLQQLKEKFDELRAELVELSRGYRSTEVSALSPSRGNRSTLDSGVQGELLLRGLTSAKSATLYGDFVEEFADFVRDKLDGDSNASSSEMKLSDVLYRRCRQKRPVSWKEIENYYHATINHKDDETDFDKAIENMRNKAPTAPATTGQMIALMELMMKIDYDNSTLGHGLHSPNHSPTASYAHSRQGSLRAQRSSPGAARGPDSNIAAPYGDVALWGPQHQLRRRSVASSRSATEHRDPPPTTHALGDTRGSQHRDSGQESGQMRRLISSQSMATEHQDTPPAKHLVDETGSTEEGSPALASS